MADWDAPFGDVPYRIQKRKAPVITDASMGMTAPGEEVASEPWMDGTRKAAGHFPLDALKAQNGISSSRS
jgi:hypothetical protein